MSKSYLIKPPRNIFKNYDVRSRIGEYLNENTYYTLGVAIASELQEVYGLHTLLLCRDNRASSASFTASLIKGLIFSGAHVIDLGCLPTPLLHFAMRDLQCKSGLMVTASHDPADYNGLKIILGENNYYGERLQALHQRIQEEQFVIDHDNRGRLVQYTSEQVIYKYIKSIKENIEVNKKLRVVVDCGNSVAGAVAPELLSALGCEVVPLNCDVQSRFTNYQPDPSLEENLCDLRQIVREKRADLGVAFAGDGDRIGVVDSEGSIVPSDYLLLAFAEALLKKAADSSLVFDIKCTQHLYDYINAHHGKPVMTKTGTPYIMAGMSDHHAAIGGEYRGHFYFRDRWLQYDDGMYAAARVLEMLCAQLDNSHLYFEKYPKSLSTNELKINIADHLKEEFMNQLLIQAPLFLQGELIQLDGLRAHLPNAWGLIRPSNTGPYLTVRFEARSMQDMQGIKYSFAQLIRTVNPSLRLPF